MVGLEGSILLWGLVLAGYLAAVVRTFRRRLHDPLMGWAVVDACSPWPRSSSA